MESRWLRCAAIALLLGLLSGPEFGSGGVAGAATPSHTSSPKVVAPVAVPAQTKANSAKAEPAKKLLPTSSTQVPEVVNKLKDTYGLPKEPSPMVLGTVPAAASLDDLVNLQRIAYPPACVTSTFYDPRTVSKYRRRAGLHLGYDIAMPAGAEVRVGWPGRVVSIAPWYDNEWGVSVLSSNGIEVTYGHIVPGVTMGTALNVGDVVGKVSVNHVDVKMRDGAGNYVPFGENSKAGTNPSLFVPMQPANSRESLMVGWLVAQNEVDTLENELGMRQRERRSVQVARERLEERYSNLHRQEVKMGKFLEDGLVARVEVEKVRRDLARVRAQLLTVKQTQKDVPEQIDKLQKQLKNGRERLRKAKEVAVKEGITWAEVNNFVNTTVAKDSQLSHTVQEYKKNQTDKDYERRIQLKKELKVQRDKYAEYKVIYDEGGLPRKELEAVEAKIQELEDELRTLPE